MAEQFVRRSDGPAATLGYFFNDTTYYFDTIYDEQSFSDKLGGYYLHTGQTLRSGVFLR